MISDENPFLAMGDWPQARKIRLGAAGTFTHNGRCRGINGYVADVRFAPKSGHEWLWRWMSAFDGQRHCDGSFGLAANHPLPGTDFHQISSITGLPPQFKIGKH